MTAAPLAIHPPSPRPAAARWSDLGDELDAWAAAGRTATLWWRDDDATRPTPALDRLLALAAAHRVPLALAVIPAAASPDLPAASGDAAILQHGYAHTNHAADGARKCELGADRPAATVLTELAEGRRRLTALFGARALPVLTPPWNRIGADVAAGLPALGFTALSTFRDQRFAVPGLAEANTHVDPVDWRGGGAFLGDGPALGAAVEALRARRLGRAPCGEPTGLLTHHLVMDAATWGFVARFVETTAHHPAVRWLVGADVFGVAA